MKASIKLMMVMAMTIACIKATAQVKIGDNSSTINSNSLLELESTNKGFLPPRVAINSTASVSPLTGTVPAGMLVYSTGGSVPDGYYYWNGTQWKLVAAATANTTVKSANATLTKSENFILASNDITLTLPAITSSDNGLEIQVKNIGSHTDLVTVAANSGSNIDGQSIEHLTRFKSETYVAYNGNWIIRDGNKLADNFLDVGHNGSWVTIAEVIEYLDEHMTEPVLIRLSDEMYEIDETIVIDLPFAITFQGLSFGTVTIGPASGLAGKPMFRCLSESYFKMIMFDATTLAGYGNGAGEDAVRLVGTETYHEIKDCTFDGFYNAILDSSNAELWLFECDVYNAKNNGLLIHSNQAGVKIRISETDFIHCKRGVNMDKASGATVQLISGAYVNVNATDTAITYHPATFVNSAVLSITGNSWNNVGKYIEGFDFALTNGRDANVIVESNAGMGDQNPNCTIGVLNNISTTTVTTGSSWYKANWTNTTSSTTKWKVENNKITYLPTNKRNGWFIISGNVACNNANRTVSIGIAKNGSSAVRYGETTLRITTGAQPFQFSTVVYLTNISPNDYFELFVTSNSSGDIITFQDIQWLSNTQ